MSSEISVQQFLTLVDENPSSAEPRPIIDVRSPDEFAKGHIPGAINVPLFDNDQRAQVGTCYKKQGHDQAVLLGLEIAGQKMRALAEAIQAATPNSTDFLIHCWRGGMRSHSMAWLSTQIDKRPALLIGGYKAYRQAAQASFVQPRKIVVLSGMTGAGKTWKLHELRDAGQQILDLEGLANHRGSSFGSLGLQPQPTCEQFENFIFEELRHSNPREAIWIEDESQSIGRVRVPYELWLNMRKSPALIMEVDREQRAKNLVKEYGEQQIPGLIQATERLTKRLGGLRTQQLVAALKEGQIYEVALGLLEYYDSTYAHSSQRDPRKHTRKLGDASVQELIECCQQLNSEFMPVG